MNKRFILSAVLLICAVLLAPQMSSALGLEVPMIYAGVQLNPVDLVGIEAEVKAISYNSNHYYDLIGRGFFLNN